MFRSNPAICVPMSVPMVYKCVPMVGYCSLNKPQFIKHALDKACIMSLSDTKLRNLKSGENLHKNSLSGLILMKIEIDFR